MELLKVKEDVKKRIGKLKGMRLCFDIDAHTRFLYGQIVRCYTFGLFDACCALCRSLVEAIAKNYIEAQGYGGVLSGTEKALKKASIPELLKNELGLQKEICKNYLIISNKADEILHNRNHYANDSDALSSIIAIQEFLEKFPKRV